MSIATLTLAATEIAIKSSGLYPHLEQPTSTSATSMVPRVALSTIPAPADTGWAVADAVACLIHIAAHEDIQRRTVYLTIDPTLAPLTGNYVVQLDATTYTYDATAEAPADSDALLLGIATLISAGSIAVATVADIEVGGTTANAIRLQSVTTGAAYTSFNVNASTAFPAAADLAVYGEYDTLSVATIYGKPTPTVAASVANALPYSAMVGRWVELSNVTTLLGGSIPSGGYLERLDLAGIGSVMAVVNGSLTDGYAVVGYAGVMFMPARNTA